MNSARRLHLAAVEAASDELKVRHQAEWNELFEKHRARLLAGLPRTARRKKVIG